MTTTRKVPHITREAAHYVVRPNADNYGAFLVVNRRVNPDDLRKIADMIETDNIEESRSREERYYNDRKV